MRLAKYLATAGVASRRAAEEIVRAGRVTVDGADGHRSGPRRRRRATRSRVDGEPVAPAAAARVVYALNKPAGVVSTARDPQGRPTVVSLVPQTERLYPVGRLDIDTTGLILLTNDGELAHRLTHPRFEVEKTYRAVVGGAARPRARRCARCARGSSSRTAGPRRRGCGGSRADTLELTIHEGRKRQVKRMCEAVGHPVKRLERVRFGPLELGDLRQGRWRKLTDAEVEALMNAAADAPAPAPP